MLRKAKDYLTWGEIDAETIRHLLTKRGERIGRKKITDEFMAENTEFPTIMALSEAIVKGDAKFTNIPWLRPVLRLHPPRKGYKNTKQDFTNKGDQGYRAEAITKLLIKMS
jgi:large subunit ribosomal protein L30